MNLPEGVAAEIKRVMRLRDRYIGMRGMRQVNVEPALALMEASIDVALDALASVDIPRMMEAHQDLKGFSE